MDDIFERSSWGLILARLSEVSLDTLFLVLAFIAFALAVWRATLRDVTSVVLLLVVGVVLLVVAL